MRIDKFLWHIRFFKTRSIATEACKKGQVKIDEVKIKPSKEVLIGDKIYIKKNQIEYIILVNDLPQSRVGAKLVGLYCTDLTPKEAFERQKEFLSSQQYYREKGEGRPTKKDRRDLDDWLENEIASWDDSLDEE